MLPDRCLSCPVCLSVTLVYCGQTVGCAKMKLGMEVGFGLGHIVLDGDLEHPSGIAPTQISAHVCCGQTARWMKMPLGTKVDLGPGHIVLDGDPAPSPRKRSTAAPPLLSAHVYCGHGRPSPLLLSCCE